ncbi:Hypothetical predicted protein [Olea europaea subsp. europaea]|uniref:Uncharacterized protein n=1 Tax=Olea europaea subsp. europaea TaxID=158383 RepID=A0A8S0VNY4_OLEEU|nr:Hypothetical predicted protein [Olea europaea subsp. europaea]
MDPANDLLASSPTHSSISSSDLDTESTGSFFHDRSTTLGILMGITLQAITFRASSSQNRQSENAGSAAHSGRKTKTPKRVGTGEQWGWRSSGFGGKEDDRSGKQDLNLSTHTYR